jgi:type I restriction enzyme S subunit
VPPGYKQTEVGVIPEDWQLRPLLSAVRVASGQVDPKIEPYRTMILVAPDHIERGSGRLLAKETAAYQKAISGKYLFENGDIVYSKIRPYLKKAILADFEGLCSADMYPLKPAADVSAGFVFSLILGHRFTKYAESVSVRSGMPKINREELAEYTIALPPTKAEQEIIAAALSDVDALINSLGKLIAKKRDLKQGAMQQLLTGQKRLPGFSGEWEVKRLGNVCPLQRGFDLPTPQLRQGNYPVVYSNGILNYHEKLMAKGPGVVTGRSGTIGNVHFVDDDFWPHNTSLWVTSFKGNSPKFIFCLLTYIGLEKFGTGPGVPTLNRNDVHAHKILIPPIVEEQTAIAAILSDMDAEIAALEQKRDKTRLLKQGMMQELLTGKTRLV